MKEALLLVLCLSLYDRDLLSAEVIRRNLVWTFEGENDPILHISNHGEESEAVQIRLLFGDDIYRYASELEIPSGENRFLRVREIVDQVGRRFEEVQKQTAGLLQIEFEGSERDLDARIVNLNPKAGITSEKESEQVRAPVIRSVEPGKGNPAGGTVVTIVGDHFNESTTVKFGGIPALHDRQSGSILIAVAPAHSSGTVDLEVSNGRKISRLKDAFRYESEPPFISAIEPEEGSTKGGTRVTIQGRNFQPQVTVSWNGNPVAIRFQSTEILSLVTPPGNSGPVPVEVINPDQKNFLLPDAFRYKGLPRIQSVSPQMGSPAGGYLVTVTGENFEPGCSVLFGSHYGQTTFINPNSLAAVVPPGESGRVDVIVTNPEGDQDRFAGGFHYNDPPTIISIQAVPNPIVRNTTSVITVTATDPEAEGLDYEYRLAQGSGSLTSQQDHATYKSPNTTGTALIQVTVYDAHRAKAQGNIEIKVE
jgi:hypothetical protein